MQTKKQNIEVAKFLDPKAIIEQLRILPGSKVADFGCGSGYFSLPLAQAVGSEGLIYSLDVLPAALEAVASKAKIEGISNILTKRVNLENEKGSKLDGESLDLVVVKDMLFQNKDKDSIVGEVYRVLRKGGRILLLEWNDHKESIGPEMSLRVPENEASKILQEKGFSELERIAAGEFHYAFVAQK